MAKNLKINVKNVQLAEALKLGAKLKKPAVKKKKAEESQEVEELPSTPLPAAPVVEPAPAAAAPPTPTPLPEPSVSAPHAEEKTAPQEIPPSPKQPQKEDTTPLPPITRPQSSSPPAQRPHYVKEPYTHRQPTGEGQRPPYSEGRRPYPPSGPASGRPPYQGSGHSAGRPPYQGSGHSAGRPPYQGSGHSAGRPPYQGSGHSAGRPPYQGSNHSTGRPPYPGSGPSSGRPPYPQQREGFGRPPLGRGPYPPRREPFARPTSGYPRPFGPRPSVAPTQEPPRAEKGGRAEFNRDTRKPAPQKEVRETKLARKEERGFDSRDRLGLRDDLEEQSWRKRRPAQKMRQMQQEEIIRPKTLKVRLPITVKDLASEMKLKASQLISTLFMKGVIITLNDYLDDETTVQLLGHDFDCNISIDRAEEDRLRITDKTIKQEIQDSSSDVLIFRPPVVAFMGHVDHGKTSLIDAIRQSNIAASEAGAITQHIGAFKCHTDAGDITILDTPGHEAFSAMRARGADVTDIVVLVIAGDEGMRPQTLEALNQANAASVPIVVAITKSDKPNFDAENVYRQLAEQNLLPEKWGGQTITVSCSAVTKAGIQELLEMLALQAEVLELKANPHSRARGTVIESQMHKGMGAVATLLIQNGTLHLGDAIVFAQHYARVKTMQDEFGKDLTAASPSTPVKITGLSGLPEAGSEFIVVKSEKEASEIAEKRSEGKRSAALHQTKRTGMEALLSATSATLQKKYLNLILRADVQGSLEALKTSLLNIASQKVELNIISSAVGEISESDVQLAQASKATIIGFHTQIESRAESLIKELKVTVRLHDIIYHAVDDVKKIMHSLLDKVAQETDVGVAEVRMIFKASQLGMIAGCMVTEGTIKRSCLIRQIRNKEVIWKGVLSSLKRVKEDVKEVSKGHECGIVLQNNNDIKEGDLLQAFEITYLEQEL